MRALLIACAMLLAVPSTASPLGQCAGQCLGACLQGACEAGSETFCEPVCDSILDQTLGSGDFVVLVALTVFGAGTGVALGFASATVWAAAADLEREPLSLGAMAAGGALGALVGFAGGLLVVVDDDDDDEAPSPPARRPSPGEPSPPPGEAPPPPAPTDPADGRLSLPLRF